MRVERFFNKKLKENEVFLASTKNRTHKKYEMRPIRQIGLMGGLFFGAFTHFTHWSHWSHWSHSKRPLPLGMIFNTHKKYEMRPIRLIGPMGGFMLLSRKVQKCAKKIENVSGS